MPAGRLRLAAVIAVVAVAAALLLAGPGLASAQETPVAPGLSIADITTTTATVQVTAADDCDTEDVEVEYRRGDAAAADPWTNIASGTCSDVVDDYPLTCKRRS